MDICDCPSYLTSNLAFIYSTYIHFFSQLAANDSHWCEYCISLYSTTENIITEMMYMKVIQCMNYSFLVQIAFM